MSMFFRKLAMLAKIETVYGTDSVPTGAANAILAQNVKVNPIKINEKVREIYLPYLGNQQKIAASWYGQLSYSVDVAGAGAAGTAPKYGPLLRACSLAEAISAGVSVTYTPVSAAFEAVSKYFYLDGVLHKFLGTRGSVSMDFKAGEVPLFNFTYIGLFQPVVDAALPTVTLAGFTTPLAVNKVNTPTFSIHAVTAVMSELSLDMANETKYRNLVNYEGVDNVDRAPKGRVQIEANLMATKNWFDVSLQKTTGALNLIHGTAAGNIVQVQAPAITIGEPDYAELDGIAMLNFDYEPMPVSGNDEFSIVVK